MFIAVNLFVIVHSDPSLKPTSRLRPMSSQLGDCHGCSISASPLVLEGEGSWVTVKVSGVSYGEHTDWVGAFAPEDIDAMGRMLKYPVRWQLASMSCAPRPLQRQQGGAATCVGEACCSPNNYTKTGEATLGFQLVNLRMNYTFALVQGTSQFPAVVATAEHAVAFARPAEPTQVHVSLSSQPGYVRVSWTTAHVEGSQWARWGSAPGSFTGKARGSGITYSADMLCDTGGPARRLGWRDPGVLWTATIGPLAPGVKVWYSVGSDSVGWTHQRADGSGNFTVSGPQAPGATSVRLIAFGDMGKAPSAWDGSLEHSWDNDGKGEVGSWNTTLRLQLEAATADAILHIGDIAYSVGYAAEWDEFMTQIEPVAARLPWMVQDGNHERNCPCLPPTRAEESAGLLWLNGSDSGGECGVPYDHRFAMPTDPATGRMEAWYMVQIGPVAAVLMSTERDFSAGSDQLLALDRLLGSVNRTTHPWLLFGGHRPMYVDVTGHVPSAGPLQRLVEPLLLRHRVDVAIWGHHHSYQRSCPMAYGRCVQHASDHQRTRGSQGQPPLRPGQQWGVTHLVVGTAGYEFSEVASPAEQQGWVAFVNNTRYGFGAIDANLSALRFAFVRSDGAGILDEVTLRRA
jgi:hypothetical protein